MSFCSKTEKTVNQTQIQDRDIENNLLKDKLTKIQKNTNPVNSFEETNCNINIKTFQDTTRNNLLSYGNIYQKETSQNSLFKTFFPIVTSIDNSIGNKKGAIKNEYINKFFCPFCNHCNNLKEQFQDSFINSLSHANNIINKGFDYIVQNLKTFDKNAIDFLSFTDQNGNEKILNTDNNTQDNNEDFINVRLI